MSVDARPLKFYPWFRKISGNSYLRKATGSRASTSQRTVRRLARSASSVPRALFRLSQYVTVSGLRYSSRARNKPVRPAPDRSSAAAKLYWSGNSPSEASFLRSFDRFEEILQEALILEIGQLATEFTLPDQIARLEEIGFLTKADRREWADCLSIRYRLLLAGDTRPQPPARDIEDALARMLQLQILLTDRRRRLFETDLRIREQENTALQAASDKISPSGRPTDRDSEAS